MIHLYVAVVIANSDVQIFKSKTAYSDVKVCEAKIPGETEHFKMMLKDLPQAEVAGAKCIDDKDLPGKDDNSI